MVCLGAGTFLVALYPRRVGFLFSWPPAGRLVGLTGNRPRIALNKLACQSDVCLAKDFNLLERPMDVDNSSSSCSAGLGA